MELLEALTVEQLRVGDEVLVGAQVGLQVVSAVHRYEDGTLVVVYFRQGEWTFENKARDRGGRLHPHRLCERGMRPMRAGEVVRGRRGRPERAEQLRDRLRDQVTQRLEQRNLA